MPALNRQGLRKLSPDLVDKASDETDEQVVRLMLAFVGTALFCLLSLASPDIGLLTGNEKLDVPGAGRVSFFGFMLLGPAILIVLRIYLQIYVEHSARLDRIARRMPVVRAPTLVPLKNPLMRVFSGFTFYLLLPLTMLAFAWKAAVFPAWGSGLLCVTAGVIASLAMLPLRRISWQTRALLSMGAVILAGGLIFGFWHPRRPFELDRANLAGVWLPGYDLQEAELSDANLATANLSGADLAGAHLFEANLTGAHLINANLTGAPLFNANLNSANVISANLTGAVLAGANLINAQLTNSNLSGANLNSANLTNANLVGANLSGANLEYANLTGAHLTNANLTGVDLIGANLSGAHLNGTNVNQQRLDGAFCGTDAILPPGLTLKPCPP